MILGLGTSKGSALCTWRRFCLLALTVLTCMPLLCVHSDIFAISDRHAYVLTHLRSRGVRQLANRPRGAVSDTVDPELRFDVSHIRTSFAAPFVRGLPPSFLVPRSQRLRENSTTDGGPVCPQSLRSSSAAASPAVTCAALSAVAASTGVALLHTLTSPASPTDRTNNTPPHPQRFFATTTPPTALPQPPLRQSLPCGLLEGEAVAVPPTPSTMRKLAAVAAGLAARRETHVAVFGTSISNAHGCTRKSDTFGCAWWHGVVHAMAELSRVGGGGEDSKGKVMSDAAAGGRKHSLPIAGARGGGEGGSKGGGGGYVVYSSDVDRTTGVLVPTPWVEERPWVKVDEAAQWEARDADFAGAPRRFPYRWILPSTPSSASSSSIPPRLLSRHRPWFAAQAVTTHRRVYNRVEWDDGVAFSSRDDPDDKVVLVGGLGGGSGGGKERRTAGSPPEGPLKEPHPHPYSHHAGAGSHSGTEIHPITTSVPRFARRSTPSTAHLLSGVVDGVEGSGGGSGGGGGGSGGAPFASAHDTGSGEGATHEEREVRGRGEESVLPLTNGEVAEAHRTQRTALNSKHERVQQAYFEASLRRRYERSVLGHSKLGLLGGRGGDVDHTPATAPPPSALGVAIPTSTRASALTPTADAVTSTSSRRTATTASAAVASEGLNSPPPPTATTPPLGPNQVLNSSTSYPAVHVHTFLRPATLPTVWLPTLWQDLVDDHAVYGFPQPSVVLLEFIYRARSHMDEGGIEGEVRDLFRAVRAAAPAAVVVCVIFSSTDVVHINAVRSAAVEYEVVLIAPKVTEHVDAEFAETQLFEGQTENILLSALVDRNRPKGENLQPRSVEEARVLTHSVEMKLNTTPNTSQMMGMAGRETGRARTATVAHDVPPPVVPVGVRSVAGGTQQRHRARLHLTPSASHRDDVPSPSSLWFPHTLHPSVHWHMCYAAYVTAALFQLGAPSVPSPPQNLLSNFTPNPEGSASHQATPSTPAHGSASAPVEGCEAAIAAATAAQPFQAGTLALLPSSATAPSATPATLPKSNSTSVVVPCHSDNDRGPHSTLTTSAVTVPLSVCLLPRSSSDLQVATRVYHSQAARMNPDRYSTTCSTGAVLTAGRESKPGWVLMSPSDTPHAWMSFWTYVTSRIHIAHLQGYDAPWVDGEAIVRVYWHPSPPFVPREEAVPEYRALRAHVRRDPSALLHSTSYHHCATHGIITAYQPFHAPCAIPELEALERIDPSRFVNVTLGKLNGTAASMSTTTQGVVFERPAQIPAGSSVCVSITTPNAIKITQVMGC